MATKKATPKKKVTTKKKPVKRLGPVKCRKCRKTKKHCKCGRPLFDGKDEKLVVQKLFAAFDFGATDEEACAHAGISIRAFYVYQKKHPEFQQEKNMRKQKPILLARRTVVKDLEEPSTAKWFLERKRKTEFSTKTEIVVDDNLTEEDELEQLSTAELLKKIDERKSRLKKKKSIKK